VARCKADPPVRTTRLQPGQRPRVAVLLRISCSWNGECCNGRPRHSTSTKKIEGETGKWWAGILESRNRAVSCFRNYNGYTIAVTANRNNHQRSGIHIPIRIRGRAAGINWRERCSSRVDLSSTPVSTCADAESQQNRERATSRTKHHAR
jgi:hypothetical protein